MQNGKPHLGASAGSRPGQSQSGSPQLPQPCLGLPENCPPVSRGRRSTEGDITRLTEEYLEKTNKETAEALLEAGGGWHPA